MKILHLPESVGGNAWGLSRGERAIGLDSRVLTLYRGNFEYPSDISYDLDGRSRAAKFIGHLKAVLRHRSGYDAYNFNYGTSILNFPKFGMVMSDLGIFDSRARKIFTYQGCDARQKYPTMARNRDLGSRMAACFEDGCYGGMCNSGERDRQRRAAIEAAAKHAGHMFAVNPDLLYFLPKEISSFVPYTVAGYDEIRPRERPFFDDDLVRIAHAPTQRVAKGTGFILAALETLKEEFGSRIEIDVVENQPHAQALDRYRRADLFIDQALVGWYGAAAVEAMKMGIPVATFVNDDHLRFVPAEMAGSLPFLRISIADIVRPLRQFMNDREMANDLSARGRRFVARWHDPAKVATVTRAAYLGEPLPSL